MSHKNSFIEGKMGAISNNIVVVYLWLPSFPLQYNNNKEYHLNSLFDDIKRKQSSSAGWSSSIWSRAKKIKRTCVIRNYNFLLFFRQRDVQYTYIHSAVSSFLLICPVSWNCSYQVEMKGSQTKNGLEKCLALHV